MNNSTETKVSGGTCSLCSKEFANRKLRNRHIKRIHKLEVSCARRNTIICPICKEENSNINTYDSLRSHLEEKHNIPSEKATFNFSSKMEYDTWKQAAKIEASYSTERKNKFLDHDDIHFACNRSNNRGYQSKQFYRTEKAGETIKMHGVCPSKLIVKIFNTGQIFVSFWKTHAGHVEDELRCKHLITTEKDMVIQKLKLGVPTVRILEDARKMETPELKRINLLSTHDVSYLARKHNIENKRDQDEMTAVALKVEEWNANGKNFAFFFKQQGEAHDTLRKEDFALGFMNSIMEEKLQTFSTIICMDGTHGTNKKGMDLTIMLIKDDRNAGFPVAFFLSNRLDQMVQEVFLDALKRKIKQEIKPDFFMSDDDAKYYNAWVNIMGNKPKRLLCSWHVVKNWNIQGRKKINNVNLKEGMKTEMKRILNETNPEKFNQLVNTYLQKLQESNELDFLNYLLKYYFPNEERIQMWAHCYRNNSGINTNMAIESLNNLLKTNQLKRKTNVTIEKLLDTIEDLVDLKMWRRVVDIQRPDANNYQDRVIIKAHKMAESMTGKTDIFEQANAFGEYFVKSSKGENFYNVKLKQICETYCKTLYCRVCKICIHRYQCDCPEYSVRNTMCKHVHLVRLRELKNTDLNLHTDQFAEILGTSSQIKSKQNEEVNQFIEAKITEQEVGLDPNTIMSIKKREFWTWIDNLPGEAFDTFLKDTESARKRADNFANKEHKLTNRKMEKQQYFPKQTR